MLKKFFTRLLDTLAPREGLLLMGLAVAVGAGTGLAAVFFIRLISFIHNFSYGGAVELLPALGRWWFVIIPVIGALISGPIIAYFAPEAKGHGVPEVMSALIMRGGRIRPRVALAKIFASALCIGSGGSAGREGPIVQVGSTLGSVAGQWLGLSDERLKNLVACGAAAGIAATFNAPIAGVVFAAEVLLSELQVSVFSNVVISAVSASIVSQIFLGARPAFVVPGYAMHSPWEIMLYVILGFIAALVGIMFIRMLNASEDLFDRWQFPAYLKPALGALLLGLLAYGYPHVSSMMEVYGSETRLGLPLINNMPHVYGSGFEFLDQVLKGQAPFWLLALLIILKPLATSFTLGSGNSGGVFAPSLFTGAMLGGAFGYLARGIFPEMEIEVGAYALVGMAAVFAATARAPLTSMLIVFEMSNDYRLILPLMAAGMVASSVAEWLHPDSIYTIKLSKKGIRFRSGKYLDVMQGVMVEEMMEKNPITMHSSQSVAELFAALQETHLHGFPVQDETGNLYGIVTIQDLERTIQKLENNKQPDKPTLRDIKVGDVATPDPVTVFPDEPIWSAIHKMAPRDLERLPVVSRRNPARMVGLISRSDILRAYDVALVRQQHEQYDQARLNLRTAKYLEFIDVIVDRDCPYVEHNLAEIPLPKNANLVSIERDGLILIPHGDTKIMAADKITILCRKELIGKIRSLLGSGKIGGGKCLSKS
ncbi:MAG: chloride channel protein [Desulfobulbaceae bacterium]|nr:chloride channel protein [Desulfobulbaceae bacterium]HIJ78208.1 CBS domain-containing protein [Deltaproteobacteria bacterium]